MTIGLERDQYGQKMVNEVNKRPIVALIDILSKKWVLRMLWELQQGPSTFRALQTRCGDISPTTINQRLKDLKEVNLVTSSTTEGYALTETGYQLIELFDPINDFAKQWHSQLTG